MNIIFSILRLAFMIYTMMIMVRIIASWFPKFAQSQFVRFLSYYTDPYINIFRRIIPPIGGVLDLSPLIAFFVLQLLEHFLFYILGILL